MTRDKCHMLGEFQAHKETDLHGVNKFMNSLNNLSSVRRDRDTDAPLEFTDKFVTRLLDEGREIMTPSDIHFPLDVDSNACTNFENDVNPLLRAMTNSGTMVQEDNGKMCYMDKKGPINVVENENLMKPRQLGKSMDTSSSTDDPCAVATTLGPRLDSNPYDRLTLKNNMFSKSYTCVDPGYEDLCRRRGFELVNDDTEDDDVNQEDEQLCTNLSEWIEKQNSLILNGAVIPEFNRQIDLLKHYACNGRKFLQGGFKEQERVNSTESVVNDPKKTRRSFFKRIGDAIKSRKGKGQNFSGNIQDKTSISCANPQKSSWISRNRSMQESSTKLIKSKKKLKNNKSFAVPDDSVQRSTTVTYIYEKQENVFKTDLKCSLDDVTLNIIKKNLPFKKKKQRYFFKCTDSENNVVYIEVKNGKAAVPPYDGQIVCKVFDS